MNLDSINLAILFALSFSILLVFVFYTRFSLLFKVILVFLGFFLFILSYQLIEEILGKPRINKFEEIKGIKLKYLAHDCLEPDKIRKIPGKAYLVFYRGKQNGFFENIPEIVRIPYDRIFCEGLIEAKNGDVFMIEKDSYEGKENIEERDSSDESEESEKFNSVDDEWYLELFEPPKVNLPKKAN